MDPLIRDGKRVPGRSWCPTLPVFFVSVLFVLPLWLFLLVPLTLLCQLVLLIPNKCCRKKKIRLGKDMPTPELGNIINLSDRKYDLVLFGATGFTGRMAAQYLASRYGNQVKWALAGRRADALQEIKDKLLSNNSDEKSGHFDAALVDIIVADSSKPSSLVNVVNNTRVVISTVGPFARYGTPLVELCATHGTSYCDITGETDWVREMVDRFDDVARKTGAYIVNMCGNDCVPWDISTLMLAKHFAQYNNDGDREVMNEVRFFDEQLGELSGGTMETIFESLENRTRYVSKLGFDPLLKSLPHTLSQQPPIAEESKTSLKSAYKTIIQNQSTIGYSRHIQRWIGPSLMASVMSNCVRHSNSQMLYSPKLVYMEANVMGGFMHAVSTMVRMTLFGTALFCPPLKWIMRALVLPKPGAGPSMNYMKNAYLKLTGLATGSRGHKARSVMYFNVDAGYLDTARMLVESGLCLALKSDRDRITATTQAAVGGVYTPATCLGEVLLDRLVASGTYWNIQSES